MISSIDIVAFDDCDHKMTSIPDAMLEIPSIVHSSPGDGSLWRVFGSERRHNGGPRYATVVFRCGCECESEFLAPEVEPVEPERETSPLYDRPHECEWRVVNRCTRHSLYWDTLLYTPTINVRRLFIELAPFIAGLGLARGGGWVHDSQHVDQERGRPYNGPVWDWSWSVFVVRGIVTCDVQGRSFCGWEAAGDIMANVTVTNESISVGEDDLGWEILVDLPREPSELVFA